jgi:hypothetical protein
LVIAALVGARVAVLLVTAGDDERSSAAAQLPEMAVDPDLVLLVT